MNPNLKVLISETLIKSADIKIGCYFQLYVELFAKIRQIEPDFMLTPEVGMEIISLTQKSQNDERMDMLFQQICSFKIKQAYIVVFKSMAEIHDVVENYAIIKSEPAIDDNDIDNMLDLRPEDMKDMVLDEEMMQMLSKI